MAFDVPSLDGAHDLLVADFATRFPEKDVTRFSDNWKRLRNLALAQISLHYHAEVLWADLWPDTCGGLDSTPPSPMLDRHGFIRGVLRKVATAAYQAKALRCTGSLGSVVHVNDALTAKDGTTYIVTASGTIGASGYVDVDVRGDDRNYPTDTSGVGSQTRKAAGDVLTFSSPSTGIAATAILVLSLSNGGADRETDAAYRPRVLNRIAQPGMGGNANDYAQWILDQPGADQAYVYPLRNGLGSVDVAFLHSGTGSERIPSSDEIAVVQAAIDLIRPVSMKMFRVLTVVAQSVDVEERVQPVDGKQWAFDWTAAPSAVVGAWDAAARVLTFVSRPVDMVAGDRITYKNTATPNTGAQAVVEALGPGANDVTLAGRYYTIDENGVSIEDGPLIEAPEVGAIVYSGGPLVEPLRQEIIALIDELGPGRGTDPTKVAGGWDDTLRTSQIFKTTQLTDGVLETTPVTPTSNVVATNTPPASSVYLLTPRQIIVRSA